MLVGCSVQKEKSREDYHDDLPANNRAVEGGNLARRLAVIVGQAEEEDCTDGPHDKCYWYCNTCEAGTISYEVRGDNSIDFLGDEAGSPEPQRDDVDLLCSLDHASSKTPCCNGDAAYEFVSRYLAIWSL